MTVAKWLGLTSAPSIEDFDSYMGQIFGKCAARYDKETQEFIKQKALDGTLAKVYADIVMKAIIQGTDEMEGNT